MTRATIEFAHRRVWADVRSLLLLAVVLSWTGYLIGCAVKLAIDQADLQRGLDRQRAALSETAARAELRDWEVAALEADKAVVALIGARLRTPWEARFTKLERAAGIDIVLTGLQWQADDAMAVVQGQAPNVAVVTQFAERLEVAAIFGRVRIQQIAAGVDAGMLRFVILLDRGKRS